MNITTPSMSSRRHIRSTCQEWFVKVWYIAENDKHVAAAIIKIEKATRSAVVILEYLLVRYCYIYHSPSKNKRAGMRWEYILNDSLCKQDKLQNESLIEPEIGRQPQRIHQLDSRRNQSSISSKERRIRYSTLLALNAVSLVETRSTLFVRTARGQRDYIEVGDYVETDVARLNLVILNRSSVRYSGTLPQRYPASLRIVRSRLLTSLKAIL